ncbi:alpha-2-macroglobulin [Plakobranchus ocellatus]|uniref:Alpha-2-macroglobulin n=1 Tax=Plakobranchus ocellatus TaxID=259542 RepID=A0AAV4BLI9_9GAST|nr:alpha-2-macroglobulin [Plakobranchus ocellatus]
MALQHLNTAVLLSSTEGKIELPETAPNKALTWTASAVCLSEKKGFGMSSTSLTVILHPLTVVFSPVRGYRGSLSFKFKVYNNVVGCLPVNTGAKCVSHFILIPAMCC